MQDTSATPVAAESDSLDWRSRWNGPPTPRSRACRRPIRCTGRWRCGDVVEVFGGAGGGQFIPELRRGVDRHHAVSHHRRGHSWRSGTAGTPVTSVGAKAVFDARVAPLLAFRSGRWAGRPSCTRKRLRRRASLRRPMCGGPIDRLDPMTREDRSKPFRPAWAGSRVALTRKDPDHEDHEHHRHAVPYLGRSVSER